MKQKINMCCKKFFEKLKSDRKTQMIFIVVLALVILGVFLIYYFATNKDSKRVRSQKGQAKLERQLDGVVVKKEETNLHVAAVIIENLVDIRPQAGLQSAGVVYEALAEGGITRFLALFAGQKTDLLGPVRSMRPYYLEWCAEYSALCTHIGGSPDALQSISGLKIKDLNAMYESEYFWRDDSAPAPHNLFTKTDLLDLALRDKKLDKEEPGYTSWKFVDNAKMETRPTEEKFVKAEFSGADYGVEYKYDREKNTYLRFNGGIEHKDRNTDKQIEVKNVMVIKAPVQGTGDDKGRIDLSVTGEGKAYMFSNGQAYEGTWSKKDRDSRTYFYHDDGKEHEFVRGNTWVEIIPSDKGVDYK